MRMIHAVQENTTEGAQQVKQTGIGGDAKIVMTLLTGIVSDKVVYPVREIATNAWEVSPPGKPFEVKLPTRFDPVFEVRDFGPGLPHKFMMDSYAKMGMSTKDGNDDAVGGWGFGSKSPLAYLMRSDDAGSFTVTSRYRGFRRVYVIGVNANSKIEIQFMGEWPLEDEDRGTGLEVSMPVRDADVDRFTDHAEAVYWSFSPRPVITPEIDFGTPKFRHKGNGWTVYNPDSVPFSGPQVKLGPVMYPIDVGLMPKTGMVAGNTCIVFEAKIGTISVSASREALQYDDRTEAGLVALFDHYKEDWLASAKRRIDAETTYFAAMRTARMISETLPGNNWGLCKDLGWHGFRFNDKLFPQFGVAKAALWPEVRSSQFVPQVFKANWDINPGELADRKVVIQHNPARSRERIQLAGLEDASFLWVRCKRVDLDATLALLGRPEHVVLDDIKLPKIATGPRVKRPESVKRLKCFDLRDFTASRELVDTDDELLFMRMDGRGKKLKHMLEVNGKERTFFDYRSDNLRSVVRKLSQFSLVDDLLDRTVVVIGDDAVPAPHWISLGDTLAEIIDEAIDPNLVQATIPWDIGSFPQELRTLKDRHVRLTLAPDLQDCLDEMRRLLAERTTLEREDTMHDELAVLNLHLTGTDIKSVAKDPTQPCRDRFNLAFHGRYPMMDPAMDELFRYSYSNHGKVSDKQQKLFDDYFKLVNHI